jgi:hypothetical protein
MLNTKLVRGRLLACLISTATVAFIAPAAAGAATTVGQTFDPTGGGFSCQDNVWQLQTTSPSNLYTVPSAGVLTAWSFRAPSAQTPTGLKLEVGRTTATPGQFLVVGASSNKVPPDNGTSTYTDIAIPVHAGDFIGMHTNGTNRDCGVLSASYVATYLGSTDPAPLATVGPPTFAAGLHLDISARLEADCNGDNLGDETGVGDTSSCNPVLAPIGAKSVTEGQTLSFAVSATDSNGGDTLDFSATNLPPGATFDPATHDFSWTPTAGQAGIYPDLQFLVNDGTLQGAGPGLKADSENVGITVSAPAPPATTPPNTAPGSTGQRAAALKKCKKKKSATARKKCKKNANKLPV